ncbi:Cytochrome P450 monooxygenase PikC [Streptomyces sp. enrichment culture]|uniref:cytochrome P450 n=1 Tax=Streptomyces TaxID=1883 RepID=UPI0016731BD3|nr:MULTISPECIES: cytochrome P450 [Streptomyces]MBD3575713.1 cytochrome P450 [Streptomyces sp. KD18]GGT25507.1 cytochrome P450 [Streptomyces toxytricini]
MKQGILSQILDYANRANPYPLYEELRRTPVFHDGEGPYVVSTYHEIHGLLHDPRLSSDTRNRGAAAGDPLAGQEEGEGQLPPSFLKLDPPEHDRLRRMTNRPFGPPHSPRRIDGMREELRSIVKGLIDGLADGRGGSVGGDGIDLVEQFSYPFPVTMICRLLGVPREDEARFHVWADTLAASLDPDPDADAEQREKVTSSARMELGMYLAGLIEERRKNPGDDMLSQLAAGHGQGETMSTMELLSTAALLLIAGHETTVNLITNGMLTLLRHPDVLERLRREPRLAVPLVEELLRYEPPVQLLPQRTPLSDIEVCGVTIPKGAPMWLVLAAGNRDPQRFENPDRFDPDRKDVQHLGLGSGIHSCFGAPLARLEAQLALSELARRLHNPRLLDDPPPYRQNAVLRGPRHLMIACDDVRP